MKLPFTASIVIYENEKEVLKRAIDSVLQATDLLYLYLIDNSKNGTFQQIFPDSRIIYWKNAKNIGFGAAHNLAIHQAIALGINYHFVINPDIYFEKMVMETMVEKMQEDPSIGLMMPQILNYDGSIQYLPKFPPSPVYMLWRKIKFPSKAFNQFINNYELRIAPPDMTYVAPRISGCFTLLNLSAIQKLGNYDERFFMYFEDSDLSRRVYRHYKTLYFPTVSVYHGYENGASKNLKLFFYFIASAIKYFNKWGWFFDRERKEINVKTIKQFEDLNYESN